MNDTFAMVFDVTGSLAEHWPDLILAAFLAAVGWLLARDISAMDKRHDKAEKEFKEQGDKIARLDTRVILIERTRHDGEA